jgi:hypothetical protein
MSNSTVYYSIMEDMSYNPTVRSMDSFSTTIGKVTKTNAVNFMVQRRVRTFEVISKLRSLKGPIWGKISKLNETRNKLKSCKLNLLTSESTLL